MSFEQLQQKFTREARIIFRFFDGLGGGYD